MRAVRAPVASPAGRFPTLRGEGANGPRVAAVALTLWALTLLCSLPALGATSASASLLTDVESMNIGETAPLQISVANTGDEPLAVVISLYIFTTIPGDAEKTWTVSIPVGSAHGETFSYAPKKGGTYEIVVRVTSAGALLTESNHVTIKVQAGGLGGTSFGPTVAGVPVVVLVIPVPIILIVLLRARSKKARQAREQALYNTKVDTLTAVSGGPRYHGKQPYDYYRERRDRLVRLRPTGLTSDGRSVLTNSAGVSASAKGPASGSSLLEEMAHGRLTTAGTQGAAAEATGAVSGAEAKEPPAPASTLAASDKQARRAIEKAQKHIDIASGASLDASRAQMLLNQANESLETENYVEAELYATNAFDDLKPALEKAGLIETKKVQMISVTGKDFDASTAQEVAPAAADGRQWPTNCPGCGMGLQAGWKECPACQAIIYPIGEAPEGSIAVAAAKGRRGPEEKEWDPSKGDDWDPSLGGGGATVAETTATDAIKPKPADFNPTLHSRAEDAVREASEAVAQMRAHVEGRNITAQMRMDVTEARDLIDDARGALSDWDSKTAAGLADEATELAAAITAAIGSGQLGGQIRVTAPPPKAAPAPAAAPAAAAPVAAAPPAAAPVCPGCGKATKPKWKICPYCETALA